MTEDIHLSKRQRKKVFIVAGAILAGVAFLMFGVTKIFPNVEMGLVAHNVKVAYHKHVFLTVIDGGTQQRIYVPADVGNDGSTHYVNRSFEEFGTPKLAPVHTHSPDGTLHMESTVDRTFTLGDFLSIWGDPVFEGREGTLEIKHDNQISSTRDYRNHVLGDMENLTLTLDAVVIPGYVLVPQTEQ